MSNPSPSSRAAGAAPAYTIAVIDSGWSEGWPIGRLVQQHDFVDGDADARSADPNTHGALVTAGILRQAPDAGIIALKVLPDGGGGADDAVLEAALQWVVANAQAYNIVAVNLSLAGGRTAEPTPTLIADELAALAAARVLTIAAAGNGGTGDGTRDVSLYAADENQICVSASTGDGGFPSWAQRNPGLTDICADGTDIALQNLAGQTFRVSGSSFAAPTVTGIAALAQMEALHTRGSRLSPDEFIALAQSTGTPMGDTGYVELKGDALLAAVGGTHGQASAQTQAPAAGALPPAPPGDARVVTGGGGIDVFLLEAARASCRVTHGADGVEVAAPGGRFTLQGIERVRFSDGTLVVDPADPAFDVYRLYQSALGREPDGPGLVAWTYAHSVGMSMEEMARQFMASPEFQERFGAAPGSEGALQAAALDNAAFVDQLYHNVLGREGDATGYTSWVAALDSGALGREEVLVGFTDSAENIQLVASQVGNGIWLA